MYSGCDAFLFPSVTDTFGMVVLEALACGLPAIVSDMGGPREIVVHGKTGYVLPADDVKAWQKAIADLIHMIHNDPPQYNKLKKQARKHVEKYYDWENIFKSLLENGGNAKGSHGKNQLVAAKAG